MLGLFKRNGILLVFSAFYVLIVALAMLELDKQYYQVAKKDLIVENHRETLAQPIGAATNERIGAYLSNDDPIIRSGIRRQFQQAIDSDDNPIYRIVVRGNDNAAGAEPVFELSNPDKFDRSNTFANSLFLRNFSEFGRVSVNFIDPDSGGNRSVKLFVYYTNPIGDSQVRELTLRYRWYASFIAIVLLLFAVALARALFIPLNKALQSLESSTPDRTVFCRRPRARLELLYNRMALDAAIARLQTRLRDEIAGNPQLSGWETVAFVARALRDQTGIGTLVALELSAPGPGPLAATGRRFVAGPRMAGDSAPWLADRLLELVPADGSALTSVDLADADRPFVGQMQVTADPDRPASRYLLAVLLDHRSAESEAALAGSLLMALSELVEAGLHSLSLRNQLVVKERGRANISLSRNLGHDLTNIIAGAKLDLMALDRLMRDGKLPDDERRLTILRESFQGLLRSVRFMQETVNLYRSYAFLQHPVLEVHDGNQLMNETLDLFGMSISGKIEIRRDLAPDAPRCMIDPRLFKLALFNMFSNSLKAIRESGADGAMATGWIRAKTHRGSGGGLEIVIEDSGCGIVAPDRRRLAPHEIGKIFELGYTSSTRVEGGGEGLGLNWVRTIIENLHGGTIRAENLPDAGARFVIALPPLERAPDIANVERKAKEDLRQFGKRSAPDADAPSGPRS